MSLQKDVSNKQEAYVAKYLNGKITPGSGCGRADGGDVKAEGVLIECKTVTKPQTSFSVKQEWLHKIKEQAFEQGLFKSALAFRFEPDGTDYIVLDITTFRELYDCWIESIKGES